MDRNIYHIYDLLMKIIILIYFSDFLEYIGDERKIVKILKTEITTTAGRRIHLDFLCELDDSTLCNIEFQFNPTTPQTLKRYFDYNIITEVTQNNHTESIIFNFTESKYGYKQLPIGESKSFHPRNFYLGDVDFEKRLNNIIDKVENNLELTAFDELDLLLMPLAPRIKNKKEILKIVVKLLEKEELFNSERLNDFKKIVQLEIKNLIPPEEQNELDIGEKMSPEAEEFLIETLKTYPKKILYDARIEGMEEGIEEGIKQGIEQGMKKGIKETAKNFKGVISDEEIAKRTGLSLKTVKEL